MPPAPTSRAVVLRDVLVRVGGGLVAVALAAVTAIAEIFYSPLRVNGVLVWVSVLLAVLVNYRLPGYTIAVTGSGRAALLPPLVWITLMLVAADRTREGDILLSTGNWVAVATVFAGSLAFAIAGYRLMLRPPPVAGETAVPAQTPGNPVPFPEPRKPSA